ncbi:MAG: Flp pilus assembly pilin Flp [Alphaproteobacteria bacterium]|jgi:Flp pilus assembly pilin Flp
MIVFFKIMNIKIHLFVRNNKAVTVIEYALLAAVISFSIAISGKVLSNDINAVIHYISSLVDKPDSDIASASASE